MDLNVEIVSLDVERMYKRNKYKIETNVKTIKYMEQQLHRLTGGTKERIQMSLASLVAENKCMQKDMPMLKTLRKAAWN